MLITRCSHRQITLSPREIEQWPDVPAAYRLADTWIKGRPAFFHVPTLDRAVPVCRHLTRLWMDLEDIEEESVRCVALLVISELMTNVIVHTNSVGLTGRLRRTSDQLLIHIRDEGGPLSVQHPHRTGYADEQGRGLVLVARSVKALGTEREADGSRTVWARVALAG